MVSEKLRDRIILSEGKRTRLYRDTSGEIGFEGRTGKVTIGVGYNIDDLGLPDDIIMVLLDRTIKNAERDLSRNLPWTDGLDDARREVLVEMCFNLGIKKLMDFHVTLLAVKDGRYADASKAMLISRWADQVGDRAKNLAKIMEKGEL